MGKLIEFLRDIKQLLVQFIVSENDFAADYFFFAKSSVGLAFCIK